MSKRSPGQGSSRRETSSPNKEGSAGSRQGRASRGGRRRGVQPGQRAGGGRLQLQSYAVGALPLVNRVLERMQLEKILSEQLPPDDPRLAVSTARVLLVLVRNVLLARQPVYGVGEWAARFAPDLLDLRPEQLALLHDDRLGRSLDRLFRRVGPQLLLAVVRQVVQEFQVSLDELHNDSTTVSFHGAYEEAAQEGQRHGRATHAITWGHSKARRPDLKQLLYTLTISEDGGVPVYFTSASGNVSDDSTHVQTWDVLHQLVGRPEFLYVADCKLASRENLRHIAQRGGRFVTVMPRTHREDGLFRARLHEDRASLNWQKVYEVTDERGERRDAFSVCAEEMVTSEGYRLLWFHSTRKAELDEAARHRNLQRAYTALAALKAQLAGPRTRFRERARVEQAVAGLLEECGVTSWVQVRIDEHVQETYRQEGPGRPSAETRFKKITRPAYTISWTPDQAALSTAQREDGLFPLLTNDRSFNAEQILRAYKRQPLIEKRFSQFKTDFSVAPVFLKSVTRIQGLLAVYFLVLLVQTLLERELRRAMAQAKVASLPLYPEGRACTRPTTQRVVEVFDTVQRHVALLLQQGDDHRDTAAASTASTAECLVTQLTPLQQQIIRLLGLAPETYGS